MIAFEKHFAAAAGAHEVVTELIKTVIWIGSSEHTEADEADEEKMEEALRHGQPPSGCELRRLRDGRPGYALWPSAEQQHGLAIRRLEVMEQERSRYRR